MLRTRIAIALLLALPLPAHAEDTSDTANSGWTKISDDDGIVVWSQHMTGVDTVTLRGEATLDATVEQIFDVMKDNDRAPKWMPLIVSKRDIRPVSENERIEYTHIGMPWPLRDRYYVNRAKVERLDDGIMRISAESVAGEYEDPAKVRATLNLSVFVLTPTADGRRTRMTLEINTDPRGMIPTFFVNRAQRDWPRKFFTGLRSQLAKNPGPVAH